MSNACERNPFCQIVEHEIPEKRCFELQDQDGCQGCAAHTRLCEGCKKVFVEFSAVGLCERCLIKQVAIEKQKGNLNLSAETQIQCRVMRKNTNAEMCLAIQGQRGCKNCAASSRLCERCKQYQCRFPQYGLCLQCSVAEFIPEWKNSNNAALAKSNEVNPSDFLAAANKSEKNQARIIMKVQLSDEDTRNFKLCQEILGGLSQLETFRQLMRIALKKKK